MVSGIKGETMQTFAVLMACLGIFAALVYSFSLWVAFAIVYLASMGLLVIIAFFGRRNRYPDNEESC